MTLEKIWALIALFVDLKDSSKFTAYRWKRGVFVCERSKHEGQRVWDYCWSLWRLAETEKGQRNIKGKFPHKIHEMKLYQVRN